MSVPSGSAGGLQPVLEHLGLHQAADVLTAWLDRAAAQELSYADFLQGLLEEESTARANAATQKRLRQAGFPFAATLEQFDFRFRPELKRQVVLRYLDPTFIEQARSLALIGPPGLGKTMLAVCVATKHIQLGATARFITAQQLANQLGRSSTSLGRQRLLRPLLACDVLVLDELGYLPTLPGFGPALYELVDRILHHGEVFYLKGPSWRVKGRSVEGDLAPALVATTTNGPMPTREEDANTRVADAGLIHRRTTGDPLGK
jgi:DNA replication protein DnaC